MKIEHFLNFFTLSFVLFFIILHNFSPLGMVVQVTMSLLSAFLLYNTLNEKSYNNIFNFLKIFIKQDFYKYTIFMICEIFSAAKDVLKTGLNFKQKSYDSKIIQITLPENIAVYRISLVTFSITITPGTTVINVENNILHVHCLTKLAYKEMQEGNFVKKILSFNLL